MKIHLLIAISFIFMGCNSIPQTKQVVIDNRPKAMVRLIKNFDDADSAYIMQNNDIARKEALDSGKLKLINYIKTDLNCKIENWPAIIKTIKVHEWPEKMIEVSFFIPENKDFNKKDTISSYNAITLTSNINYDDTKLRNLLKGYDAYDKVLVTGVFTKDIVGDVDFTGIEPDDNYLFTNPQFEIDLIALKKVGTLE